LCVCLHSTIITPVIHEWDDKFDVVLFGGGYNYVELLEAVGAGVDLRLLAGDKTLKPNP